MLWDYPPLPEALDPADATTGNDWFVVSPDTHADVADDDRARSPGRRAIVRRPAPAPGDVVQDAEVDIDAELAKLRDQDPDFVDLVKELDAESPHRSVACGRGKLDDAAGPFSPSELRDAYETGRLGPDALVWRDGGDGDGDVFSPLVDHGELPTWGRRQACAAVPLVMCDVGAQCELCGGLATLHSVDALKLQLAEGDCDGFEDPSANREPRAALQPKAGSTIDAKEIVDGTLWIGGKAAALEAQLDGLHVTHVVRVVDAFPAPPAEPAACARPPTLQEEMETRELTDWEMRLVIHDAHAYDEVIKGHAPRRISSSYLKRRRRPGELHLFFYSEETPAARYIGGTRTTRRSPRTRRATSCCSRMTSRNGSAPPRRGSTTSSKT